jgi:hypothetical protein
MLERIINITPGSDYKQSSRSTKQSQAYRTFETSHAAANDSISLSPATSFLSVIKWKLKKFRKENEKLLIEFSFDEFDFSTTLLIGDIIQIHNIDYDIRFISLSYAGQSSMELRIGVPFSYDPKETIQYKKSLNGLRGFLTAVATSYGSSNTVLAENYEVQKKFSENEFELYSELDYINRCLMNFLDKHLSLKIAAKIGGTKERSILELKSLKLIKM